MPDKNICPICGFDQIDHEIRPETVSDYYCGQKEVSLAYDCCRQCGTDGDFGEQNDKLIREALDKMKAEYVKIILQDFAKSHMNFAGMERALELPQRTLAKWKNGTSAPSAAGVTLLKFLNLFPWLVDVADYNFDFNNAQRIHIKAAFDKLLPKIDFTTRHYEKNTAITLVTTTVKSVKMSPNYLEVDNVYPDKNIATGYLGPEDPFQDLPELGWLPQTQDIEGFEYANK
jgi:DNA-binding transcriptional regulator YiaG